MILREGDEAAVELMAIDRETIREWLFEYNLECEQWIVIEDSQDVERKRDRFDETENPVEVGHGSEVAEMIFGTQQDLFTPRIAGS